MLTCRAVEEERVEHTARVSYCFDAWPITEVTMAEVNSAIANLLEGIRARQNPELDDDEASKLLPVEICALILLCPKYKACTN